VARIALVTGGCRSGKSAYAQQMAESLPPPRLYVATCPVTDEEMQRRIEQHRRARHDRGWETIEEQLDLTGVLRRHGQHNVLLVDCVTLWVNNLMYHAEHEPEARQVTETDVAAQCGPLLEAAQARRGTVILVTNEVGLGVVPENAQARRYRDLVGRVNQIIAARASGHGLRTSVIQFINSDASVGEIAAARATATIEIYQTGLGFVPPADGPRFARHRAAAEAGLRQAAEVLASGQFALVILDEVCVAVARGLIEEHQVTELLTQASPMTCLVLTGRDATPALIALADTVTEMRCLKHGLQAGRVAQEGVER